MLFTTCRSNSKSHDQHFAKLMLNTVGMSAPSLDPELSSMYIHSSKWI